MHDFVSYLFYLLQRGMRFAVPAALICGLILAVCYAVCRKKGRRFPWGKAVCAVLLVGWAVITVFVTLLRSEPNEFAARQWNLQLFRAWREAYQRFTLQIWLNVLLNIALFVPLGVLLPLLWKPFRKWYAALGAGFGVSLLIELAQLLTARGMCDVDDLFTNTLGAMLGWCAAMLVLALHQKSRTWPRYCALPAAFALTLSAIFISYAAQPYGNLRDASVTTADLSGVRWSVDFALDEDSKTAYVYQAQALDNVGADRFAAEFAAAVSNAGALGLIGAGGMTPDSLRENIRRCRELTDRPFGVNVMLMHPRVEEMVRVVAEERVMVVTTGAGNPGAYIPVWKEYGAKVLPVVPAVAVAKVAARAGADAVIAEGTESGGHVGELTTMALVPQVCDAVDLPVVAAGGIADGRQLLAAYALGACGAQVGTCLLVSQECPIHENYKQAILKAKDSGTIVTGRISGTPVRILKNQMARTYVSKERAGATMMELEQYTLGSLRRAVFDGDTKTGSLMAGQVAGMLHEIKPLRQIFEELSAGCDRRLAELRG